MKTQLTDEQLIVNYFNGNLYNFDILINRYRRKAKTLASSLLLKFKSVSSATFDDLVAIGLNAVHIAMKNYNHQGSFFAYWRLIASNMMMQEIKLFSLSAITGSYIKPLFIDEVEEFDASIASPSLDEEMSKGFLYERVMEILNDENNKIDLIDKIAFIYYLDEYSYTEISQILELSYYTTRQKISRVREKVGNILKHSKE